MAEGHGNIREMRQLLKEIAGESDTFSINCESVPQTAVAQCMVSYKRFVDYIHMNYGVEYFFENKNVLVSLVLKDDIKQLSCKGLSFSCPSIKSAINISKKYLTRSRHGFVEFRLTIDSVDVPVPVIRYSVFTREPKVEPSKCRVLKL